MLRGFADYSVVYSMVNWFSRYWPMPVANRRHVAFFCLLIFVLPLPHPYLNIFCYLPTNRQTTEHAGSGLHAQDFQT